MDDIGTEGERMQVVEQTIEGVNGAQAEIQLAPLPPPPQLFDMDLERMHIELYRNRYTTPDEFLDDIRKIVHNAHTRFFEDNERLYRAQAMLTAAEVSIGDFDPQFKLECQRMAQREHKRRAERRKAKDKGKANEETILAPRRSARNAGQQAEISITDPLMLERRLKRQRSNEAGATPSEDETSERAQKRSRNEVEGLNDLPPMEFVDNPATPPRPAGVRFVDATERPATPVSPSPNGPSLDPLDVPRRSGFDPSLLNPLPSTEVGSVTPLAMAVDLLDPEQLVIASQEHMPNPVVPALQTHNVPLADALNTTQFEASTNIPSPTTLGAEIQVVSEVPAAQPMEVERTRTPTPPLPEFRLNEASLLELRALLRDQTGALNVEQLEQLRATCLSCIWRRRTDWDRDNLIRELTELVNEFVEEVRLDAVDDAASPLSQS